MVSGTRILLILAADRREFEGFRPPTWKLEPANLGLRWSALGSLHGVTVMLAANGPGRANAQAAVDKAFAALEQVSQAASIGAIVSTGWVGGLNPELVVGDIFCASSVLELGTGVEYSVNLAQCTESVASGRLITVDSVIQDAVSKAALRKSGDAVDMEAAAVARGAQNRRLPFYCIRAVSDDARTSFEIDFNRARRDDGTFSGWKVASQAGLSPKRWRQLMELKKGGELASRNLAAFLASCRIEF